MSEPATSYVVEGILVEFTGMHWSSANTATADVQTQSWVTEEFFYNNRPFGSTLAQCSLCSTLDFIPQAPQGSLIPLAPF